MTTTLNPALLTKMGGRYWYATAAKIAHAFVADFLAGGDHDDLVARASELKAMLDAGPWADAEKVRAELTRELLSSHECVKTTERVRPDPVDMRAAREAMREQLLVEAPFLANPLYKYAVDSFVRCQALLLEIERWVELNPSDDALATTHRSYTQLCNRLAASLLLTPKRPR